MGLSGHEILDIIELVYYVPAFFLALWVVKKHGHGRQIGWIFLVILSILRIVGASTGIAAVHSPSTGLITTSLICYGIGLSPLLLALQGIIMRVNEGMRGQGLPLRTIRIVGIPIIVGLVIGIVAGTKEFSSDHSTVNDGYTLAKAASILFLLGFLALAGITVVSLIKKASVLDGEKRLLMAALCSLPFIAVRVIYAILVSFDHNSSAFDFRSTGNISVIVQAIMSLAMEFIVVAIYLAAGLFARTIPRSMVKEGYVDPPSYIASTRQQSQQQIQSRDTSLAYPLTTAPVQNKQAYRGDATF